MFKRLQNYIILLKQESFLQKVWWLNIFYLLLQAIIQLTTQNLKLYCLSKEIYFITNKFEI